MDETSGENDAQPLSTPKRAEEGHEVVVVDVSPHFRETVSPYLTNSQVEGLRKWMSVGKDFGDVCGPHGIQMVEFPPNLRACVPTGWRIFFCHNEITADDCEADITLLAADKPDKRVWDRVKAMSADAAYIAGHFIDGIYTISGK